jgi:hypothetical protein
MKKRAGRGIKVTDTVQLALGISAAALPTITVLVGILLNRGESTRLDTRIASLDVSLRGDMASMRAALAALRNQFHADVLMLLSSDKEQDQRITRLENR